MFKPSGSIFYQDYYNTLYRVDWETTNGQIDITTIIMQPRVWGELEEGYIKNRIVFRKGIITVTRQILKPKHDGYEIVAEGVSQYIDFIQTNFPYADGPQDTFQYHFDNSVLDETDIRMSIGPHWTDPSNIADDIVFTDLDIGGVPLPGTEEVLEWVDVWE